MIIPYDDKMTPPFHTFADYVYRDYRRDLALYGMGEYVGTTTW